MLGGEALLLLVVVVLLPSWGTPALGPAAVLSGDPAASESAMSIRVERALL